MSFSQSDYKYALYRLMPRGPIWPNLDWNAPVWDALLDAIAAEFARFDENEEDLLRECFPDTCTVAGGGLPAWEYLLGLPDECTADEVLSEDDRRQIVLARLIASNAYRLADWQAIADTFDRDAVVSEGGLSSMFKMGLSKMGGPEKLSYGDLATQVVVTYDGPQLVQLECAVRRAIPQHITVTYEVV